MRSLTEEGTAAIMLAVSLTVLFGAAAIVLDAGDIWQERRQLVGATDAAALAAAQDDALGLDGCATTAGMYLESNSPGSSLVSCSNSTASSSGTMEVAASIVVEHGLAQVLGRDETTVTASSGVRWGAPATATGLRPFALCNASDGFMAWQASGHNTTDIFRITYSKAHAEACGGPSPGNWGILDFNGGANSNNDTANWVASGYPGHVSAMAWSPGDPGAFDQSLPINSIVGKVIQLPVFDDYDSGGGDTANFHVVGFVSVEIVAYRALGPQASRYLDLRFTNDIVVGSCCTNGGLDAGTYVVTLCSTEQNGSCV